MGQAFSRKSFLNLLGLSMLSTRLPAENKRNMQAPEIRIPYLQPGDLIGITTPAGYATIESVADAVEQLKRWGFQVRVGDAVGKRDYTFGGNDAERRDDLQQMLDDPTIKAILFARGGYGAVRIIDQLDFSKFRKKPKWLIGFSDITVLHSHINRQLGLPTIHAKMCNSFPEGLHYQDEVQHAAIESIRQTLTGVLPGYQVAGSEFNIPGTASGVLIGGNLKTLESLAGSASDIQTRGKILFIEDVGEALYSIDRMCWNLLRTGKLQQLAGLIVGGFKIKADPENEVFGLTLEQIIREKVSNFNYPVCFGFPVGHQLNNVALVCGHRYELNVTSEACRLQPL